MVWGWVEGWRLKYLKHGDSGVPVRFAIDSLISLMRRVLGGLALAQEGACLGWAGERTIHHPSNSRFVGRWLGWWCVHCTSRCGTLAQGRLWYSPGGHGVARARIGGVNSGARRAPVAMEKGGGMGAKEQGGRVGRLLCGRST